MFTHAIANNFFKRNLDTKTTPNEKHLFGFTNVSIPAFATPITQAIKQHLPFDYKNLPTKLGFLPEHPLTAIKAVCGTYHDLLYNDQPNALRTNSNISWSAFRQSVFPHKNLNSSLILHQMSNSKTDETLVQPITPKVDLTDVGGNPEIIDRLADVVRFLQRPQDFSKMGVKMPKGIILSGPPGVGKSFMAEAIAGHAGVPLFLISASSLQDIYVGGTEKKLRDVFAAARKAAPCVLCIDEIDSLGQKRFETPQYGSEHFANGIVNQLLTLLSEDNNGVIILATTNNFATLDPALIRPGRFDRHISIPKPNAADREQILRLHTKNKPLNSSISLTDLARQCVDFTGADLATLVNEAAINAVRRNSKAIGPEDFDQARRFMKIGVTGKAIADPVQKRRTAAHEAAHGLVSHLLNHPPHRISILQHGQERGFTELSSSDDDKNPTRQDMLDEICVSLAGRAGEELTNTVQVGCTSDLDHAKQLAHIMVDREGMGVTLNGVDPELNIELILSEQMQRARQLLEENQNKWNSVTKELVQHNELTQTDFLNILRGKSVSKGSGFLGFTSQPESQTVLSLPPKGKSVSTRIGIFTNPPASGRALGSDYLGSALDLDYDYYQDKAESTFSKKA